MDITGSKIVEVKDSDDESDIEVPPNAPGIEVIAKAIEEELGVFDEPIGSIHVLPLTAQKDPRYGACRLLNYSKSKDELRLEWVPELHWKPGEKRANWVGSRFGKGLGFSMSSKAFHKARAQPSSIKKTKVCST